MSQQIFQKLSQLPSATPTPWPLAAGDNQTDSFWRSLVNLRLRTDGRYLFWKTRGGSSLVNSFAGNILTLYPFRATLAGATKSFIAVHTAMGKVFLWDITGGSANEIVSGGFSTTTQIQFASRGRLLYMFDYEAGQAKYYDADADAAYDFGSYDKCYISAHNYRAAGAAEPDIPEKNLWGFRVGQQVIVFPNAETNPTDGIFESYKAEIREITSFLKWEDPNGRDASTSFGDPNTSEDLTDKHIVIPYSSDLEELVGIPSNKRVSIDTVVANDKYIPPVIYRGYLVLDMLSDGSITIPGLPLQLAADPTVLYQDGAVSVRLTLSAAPDNVVRRFLCATRWQPSPEAAFNPTSTYYPDSPLYIVGEVDTSAIFVDDKTPDQDLLRPITELLPTTAGVADLFGSGQFSPRNIASFSGALMAAGYKINRPIPDPYTDPATETDGNIFLDFTATTQLANNMAIAFQFEYTDGRRSNIVQTEEFFQEGSATETTPIACDQPKAQATHTVTAGCSSDDTLTVTYDGYTVNVALTAASHPDPADVAEAIRQAVEGDSTVRINAAVPAGADIEYTEKRFGEEFNSNIVDIDPATTGVTFDTQDPALSGASDPEGLTAKVFVNVKENNLNEGETEQIRIIVDGNEITPHEDAVYQQNTGGIEIELRDLINNDPTVSADWTASIGDPTGGGASTHLIIESKVAGDVSWNGRPVSVDCTVENAIVFEISSPGNPVSTGTSVSENSAGANPTCLPASASIDVSANGLAGGATEDHTITVDGNSTSPITINDTDTTEGIVDKYIAEIQSTPAIDIDWDARKVDQGSGVWRLLLEFRQYGEIGNTKIISVSGDTDVSLTVTSPASGGADAGTTPVGAASEVSANRIQIHSLNQLISRVYVLGRTGSDPNFTFHPIEQIEITDPQAHGMIIELPNTTDELDDIETVTFSEVPATEILESVVLQNYVNIAIPFQQFQISTQREIVDQSNIIKAVPMDFDPDKSSMRYRVMLFTDQNIQLGYLVEQTTEQGQIVDARFETILDGLVATSREGITRAVGRIFIPTEDAVYMWSPSGVTPLFNASRYDVSDNNNLVDVVHNQKRDEHNELWFIYRSKDIIAYDLGNDVTRRMKYNGIGSIRAGAYFGEKMYIAGGTDLLETDIDGQTTDTAGATVEGKATSIHIGDRRFQEKLLEVTVAGSAYNCQLLIDLQTGRRESESGWSKTFSADVDKGTKALDMAGVAFQVHRRAIMPRIRLVFESVAGGHVESVTVKSVTTENKGKARQ